MLCVFMRLMLILKKKVLIAVYLFMPWGESHSGGEAFPLGCWASPASSGQHLRQQLLTELHVHSSEGTAAAFVCFSSSLNKWLIRNWAKNYTQHKTGRCLVLLECARDMVRGKGDALGGNIVSLERFGFSVHWKMSLVLYHGKSGAANPSAAFLGGAAEGREKSNQDV